MAGILRVLYPDPVDGHPTSYARADIPKVTAYPNGQSLPTPHAVDFRPGELLGDVFGGLGLRAFLKEKEHSFIVTSDMQVPGSVLERELPEANIVISQPSWPAYLTAEHLARAG